MYLTGFFRFSRTTLLGLFFTAILSACGGGGTLSFKNADTFIESYTNITKDMSETDRKSLGQNIMLILEANEEGAETLTLRDIGQAENKGSDLKYLTSNNPLAKEFASELAIAGAEVLDGKSVEEIAKKSDELKNVIRLNTIKANKEGITTLKESIEKLNKDMNKHEAKRKELLLQQKELSKKTEIFKPNITIEEIKEIKPISNSMFGNGYGIKLKLKATIFNPLETKIHRVTPAIEISYNNYVANIQMWPQRFDRPKPGETGEHVINTDIHSYKFSNEENESLKKDYQLPTDPSAFQVTLILKEVNTLISPSKTKKIKYSLPREDEKTLSNSAKNISNCKNIIKAAQDNIKKHEEQITLLDSKKTLEGAQTLRVSALKSCERSG